MQVESPPSSRTSRTTRTILIVEDQALIAMYEARLLGNNGYDTRVVHNAEDAIAAGIDPGVDLILMDIDLGCNRCGGTEAATEILRQREVPIVFLTSHSEKEMVDRVKGITRYGYVLKNAGEFVLLESVAMAFELFQANRALQLNEALYRNLMENSVDAVYLLSEEGAVLNVNAVACEMTGYTREELLSLTIDDIDPNYPSKTFVEFWRNKPEGATMLFETLHRRKDGTVFPVEVNGIFFVLDGVKRLYGVARDISERRAQEERDRIWSDLFDHAQWGIVIGDATGTTLERMNPAFAAMHGYTVEELTGKPIVSIFPPQEREKVEENIRIAHEIGHHTWQSVQLRKDGSTFPVLIDITAVRNGDGEISHRIVNVQDISQLRQSERRMSAMFEYARDPYALISVADESDYRILEVNRAYLEALNRRGIAIKRETLVNARFCDAAVALGLDHKTNDLLKKRFNRARTTKEVQRYRSSMPSPLGPVRLEETLVPILEENGMCTTVLYSARELEDDR